MAQLALLLSRQTVRDRFHNLFLRTVELKKLVRCSQSFHTLWSHSSESLPLNSVFSPGKPVGHQQCLFLRDAESLVNLDSGANGLDNRGRRKGKNIDNPK